MSHLIPCPARVLARVALLAAVVVPALGTGVAAAQDVVPPAQSRNSVAVVVGLSSYANLPDQVELDFARSDAASVVQMFRHTLHYSHVFLLADGQATKAAILDTLRTEVAQLVGPDDLFVLYFAGHGIGADLGIPTFLANDSTLENGQEDGIGLADLARDLSTWTSAGTSLIVTDAIHRNQLGGIYFYGPAANEWPAMPPRTAIISSSEPLEAAIDGSFAREFIAALSGAADTNGDHLVTVQELFTRVHDRLGPTGQIPVLAGQFNPGAVLAQGVDSSAALRDAGEPPEPEDHFPDVDIDKSKFVFLEGQAQTVACSDVPKISCAPSCYVWNFKGGRCNVTAIIDGFPMEGEVVVLARGRYQCRRQGPNLVCAGPD